MTTPVEPGVAVPDKIESSNGTLKLSDGYGFYLLKGTPVWCWNMIDFDHVKSEGKARPPQDGRVIYPADNHASRRLTVAAEILLLR